jgi:hypothetical protein
VSAASSGRECGKLKPAEQWQQAGGEERRKRILFNMKAERFYRVMNGAAKPSLVMLIVAFCAGAALAQDANGPLIPPPSEDHNVHRVTTADRAAAPPPMAPALIIKAFAEKEDQYLRARVGYGYKKTIKLTEFGKDGQPSGEYQVVLAATVDPDGTVYEKTVEKTQSSLRFLDVQAGALKDATRIPAFPLTTSQLAKYELRYVGDEKVDEVDCYIFEAKPKFLERGIALFQGVVWVDKQYLEVVKTYGKWVNDLGDVHLQELPFVNFETYRENVDGKYWFPNYARSDGYFHLNDENVPIRMIIKWADMKPLPAKAMPKEPAKP